MLTLPNLHVEGDVVTTFGFYSFSQTCVNYRDLSYLSSEVFGVHGKSLDLLQLSVLVAIFIDNRHGGLS